MTTLFTGFSQTMFDFSVLCMGSIRWFRHVLVRNGTLRNYPGLMWEIVAVIIFASPNEYRIPSI